MKKLLTILLPCLGLFLAIPAHAQYTSVTATVTDPNGTVYINCSVSAVFVPSPTATQAPTFGNPTQTFPLTVTGARCDSFGAFTLTLADNNLVVDGHTGGQQSEWKINICTSPGQVAGGPLCFSYTSVVTGASEDLTTALKAASSTIPQTNITGIQAGTTGDLMKYGTTTTATDSGIVAANVGQQTGGVNGNFVKATGANTSTDSGVAVNNVALLSGTNAFSASNTVGTLNGAIYLDGTQYAKTQAGLVSAIAAATSAGTCVVIPPNTTITITTAVTWNASNACLYGNGITSVLATTGSSSYTAISFTGTGVGASSDLNSDSSEGSSTVALVTGGVSSLGLAVGDYILISDSQTTPAKEVTRITAISTDTLTTADMMYENFTTSNTAKVQKLTAINSVRAGNFKLDLTGNTGATSEGIALANAVNSSLFDIDVTGNQTGAFGIQVDTGYRNVFRNLTMTKVGTTSTYADFNVWTNTNATFQNISSLWSGCFGPEFAWVNGSQFDNITSIRANYRGFKTTRASWNNISNLTVVDASTASAGVYTGIHLETGSRRNNISNFIANNDGLDGLAFDPTSDNNTAVNGVVVYNTDDILFDVGTQNNSILNTSYTVLADNSGNNTNTATQPGAPTRLYSCGTTTTCGNVALYNTRIVVGSVSLSTGTATITGVNGFTSTGTYFCVGTDATAANPVQIALVSASSFTITGTGSDSIFYHCEGN